MTCSKMISAIKPYFIYIFLLIGISILTGCASLDTINTPAPKQPNGAGDIIVTGGDQTNGPQMPLILLGWSSWPKYSKNYSSSTC